MLLFTGCQCRKVFHLCRMKKAEKGISILMIDDDEEDHMIMQEYFDDLNQGSSIRFFPDAAQAITFLNELAQDLPKLIVLDLNMPVMTGTQMLLHLKHDSRFKSIPVIIYSTSENAHEKKKCLDFGAIDYMVKPNNYDAGIKVAERFLTYLK